RQSHYVLLERRSQLLRHRRGRSNQQRRCLVLPRSNRGGKADQRSHSVLERRASERRLIHSFTYGRPKARGARDAPMKPASTIIVRTYGIIWMYSTRTCGITPCI